jgi:IS30 family transposase
MSHLTYEQRYTIEVLLRTNEDKPSIAKKLSIHKSVLYREIKFTDDMKDKVNHLLREKYSPEQISGVLEKNGEQMVSHERIYQHVWNDKKQKGLLHTHLRKKVRKEIPQTRQSKGF